MKNTQLLAGLTLLVLLIPLSKITAETGQTDHWTRSFNLENCSFADIGENRYFILDPGYRLVLSGMEDEDSVRLVITVLDDMKEIDGIRTRVVEERETVGEELVEVSRNYYAFCRDNASIFYFGEDVDVYENGKIIGHGGSWKAGENDNRPGLMMPGLALSAASYYQEIAPGIAMDRARIITTDSTIQTPTDVFEHCLVIEESSDLEPGVREYKNYAPGVGIIRDGPLWLVSSGFTDNEKQ